EDGIRDGHVTGVQTCALPIWSAANPERRRSGYCRRILLSLCRSVWRRLLEYGPASEKTHNESVSMDTLRPQPSSNRRRSRVLSEIGRASGRERGLSMSRGGSV